MCEENVMPSIKRTAREEFLLNGPTNEMGMVVTAGGVSQHQPLWWTDTFRSAAYSYPYVLVLGRLTVAVHSMLDQKEKQMISLSGGILLNDFEGCVYVVYENAVRSLVPVSLREQIQMLLMEKRVEEMFDLLQVATETHPREYNDDYKKLIQAQAGFIYFSNNLRGFSLSDSVNERYLVEDLTRTSIDADFDRKPPHVLFKLSRK